mmetsp:Transcript_29960/g.67993  ORF Transcript_29960/g.67993 Transcript_29960/m.67993 type:complete len:248 (+) Transcript_29960:778-1521(+)
MLGSSDEESTQEIERRTPTSRAACWSAFTTLTYASGLPVYLPTTAMETSSLHASNLSAITCQSPSRLLPALGDIAVAPSGTVGATTPHGPSLHPGFSKPSRSQISRPTSCSARSSGTRYKFDTSCRDITHSGGTWQNKESFWRTAASTGFSERHMRMSGMRPASRSSLTECWQGFVFCSPVAPMTGSIPKWIMRKLSLPARKLSCCNASRYTALSMSPTVPPSSTRQTSGHWPELSTGLFATSAIHS